ncbi:MAG: hypothetical protein AB7P03_19210 [Kofleriaceae bacterium]
MLTASVAGAQPADPPPAEPTDPPASPATTEPAVDPPAVEPKSEPAGSDPEADLSAEVEAEPEPEPESKLHRNFAGSVQLDYMAVPTEKTGRGIALDGATAEVSLKLAMDFSSKISANVKVCVACHGFEVGMAFFDVRVADELNFRVGRFTPAFGEFPVRHDPANHRTSDKPLPYDMGRMLRMQEWNEGVLPAPWIDNGLEINGTHFFGDHVQTDYAVYAIGGPRGTDDPIDFDFRLSRSPENYYIDNNSRPVVGGQVVLSLLTDVATFAVGISTMRGTYDPDHKLPFEIYGAHTVLRIRDVFLRAEYLQRRTKMSLGDDPASRFKYGPNEMGIYDPYVVKDGAYVELEVPLGSRLSFVAREDALRRRGNVLQMSPLRSESVIVRSTAGLAILLRSSLRLKLSYELYDFSDFEDEQVGHIGIAGPF